MFNSLVSKLPVVSKVRQLYQKRQESPQNCESDQSQSCLTAALEYYYSYLAYVMSDKEIGRGISMHIRPDFFDSVAFLCTLAKQEDGKSVVKPCGSTFFIELPDEKDRDTYWPYFVTARHCIEWAEGENIWIRLNTVDKGFEDLLTKKNKWFIHDGADVAIIPFGNVDRGSDTKRITAISTNFFVSSQFRYAGPFTDLQPHFRLINPFAKEGGIPIQIGEYIYFIGLFTEEYGKKRNRPIVRRGIIARTPNEPITLKRDRDSKFDQLAYLVESFSWPGHSGSPVIWVWDGLIHGYYNPRKDQWAASRLNFIKVWEEEHRILPLGTVQGLLGLVSAHFGTPQKAEITGDIIDKEAGAIETELNTGIAAVTPSHYISELLFREDVVADRERVRKATEKNKHLPTMD